MAAYSKVEEVAAQPRNINSGPNGWGFTMWSNKLDDEAPHRSLLERFAAAHPDSGIKLSKYERYEDYVETTAAWNGGTVEIYYETILSYLWLWSADRESVQSFRAALLPLVS